MKSNEDVKKTESTARDLEYAKVTFSFYLTRDEAEQYRKKPNGQVAKNLRRYMIKILEEAIKRFDKKEIKDDM